MHISIQRDELLPALSAAIRSTSQRGIQPILANILVETLPAENALRLSATDLDMAVQAKVVATIHDNSVPAVTLPARKLLDIVSKLPALATLQLRVDNEQAHLESAGSRYDIRVIAADDFPPIAKLDADKQVTLRMASLLRAINQTSFAAASHESHNVLGGVYVKLSPPNVLEMAATDGSRLACYSEQLESALLTEEVSAIVPAKGLQEIARLCAALDGTAGEAGQEPMIRLAIANGQISFETSRFHALVRLLDGQYPRYSQLIPQANSIVIEADRRALMDALERTAVMANERTNMVKMNLNADQLELMANSPDLGDSRDGMAVRYSGDPLTIAFNYRYVLDALKVIESEAVRLETNGALAPTLFRPQLDNTEPAAPAVPTPDGNALCLIMPIQVR